MEHDLITVELCMGSACFARGNNKAVTALRAFVTETDLQDRVHIKGAMCAGLCKNGPVVKINGTPYYDLSGEQIAALLREMTKEI